MWVADTFLDCLTFCPVLRAALSSCWRDGTSCALRALTRGVNLGGDTSPLRSSTGAKVLHHNGLYAVARWPPCRLRPGRRGIRHCQEDRVVRIELGPHQWLDPGGCLGHCLICSPEWRPAGRLAGRERRGGRSQMHRIAPACHLSYWLYAPTPGARPESCFVHCPGGGRNVDSPRPCVHA